MSVCNRMVGIGALGLVFAAICGCSSSSAPAPAGSTTAMTTQAPAVTATATASATAAPTATATATAAASGKCPSGMVAVGSPPKYCVDKTEVTVAAFKKCVDDGKCQYTKPANPGCNWHDAAGKANHPMNCVGRTQASQYCSAMGASLPSVEEWEYASRDGENKPYAWGTDDPQKATEDKFWCWSGKQKRTGTCEVGSFPAGATKAGLLDMSGNVAEWALGGDEEEKSKTCGRAWDANEGWKAMEKCPGGYFAEAQVPVIGFRCLKPHP